MIEEGITKVKQTKGEVVVRLCQTPAEMAALFHQSWLVLRMPPNMAIGTEQDEHDAAAQHIIAIDQQQQIVGSARLRKLSEEMSSIAYVAVLPEFQKQDVGTALIEQIIAITQMQKLCVLRVMS